MFDAYTAGYTSFNEKDEVEQWYRANGFECVVESQSNHTALFCIGRKTNDRARADLPPAHPEVLPCAVSLQSCRIAPVDISACERALNTLTHRGPDAEGQWIEAGVFLGHRRLSIIDLATGDQPMHSSDGRYIIVFNGEICQFSPNYVRSSSRRGAKFNTHSDTEVILEGYRRWGADVVHRLHGMFAFVSLGSASPVACSGPVIV